jgi:hypothetical protein
MASLDEATQPAHVHAPMEFFFAWMDRFCGP